MEDNINNRKIVEILDGDTLLLRENDIDYKMPYLSGPTICEIGRTLGAEMEYNWSKAEARKTYMGNLIDYCMENKKLSTFFNYLFSKSQFSNMGKFSIDYDFYIQRVKNIVIDMINDSLSVSNCKLLLSGNKYIITNLDDKVTMDVATVKDLDMHYIQSISSRAYDDLSQGNFDSAITKARTTVEEIFHYIIESNGTKASDSGKLNDLYKQVKQILNMGNNPNLDTRINGLLSALQSIVSNIASMRNISSDSHGLGQSRISIDKHHAKLVVNCAMALCEFILESYNKQKNT